MSITTKTQKPKLTPISTGNTAIDGFIKKLVEIHNVEEGVVGKGGPRGAALKLDKKPTYRDLMQLGLVVPVGRNGYPGKYTGPKITDGFNPGAPFGQDKIPPDYGLPPAPTGLTASGGFTIIFVKWDIFEKFNFFAHTEVWRSMVDDLGTAVLIGTSQSNVYIDTVGSSGLTYYYWVRFVKDVRGTVILGPFNGTAGTMATAGEDPAYIIGQLVGQIKETELAANLATRIDLVDAGAEVVGSVNARVAAEAAARGVAIDAVNASILSEQTSRINADSALATDVTALYAASNNNAAAILNEQTVRANADSALATDISNLGVTVSNNSAAILNEQTVRANADSALSSSISSLSTTVNGNTASISTVQSSVNGLALEYMVKLDNNGYVTGYGQFNNGPGASGFIVRTDLFAIARPGVGASQDYPFLIGQVDGVTKIALNAATFLPDATITGSRIATSTIEGSNIALSTIAASNIVDSTITNAKIADSTITGSKITLATITGSLIAASTIVGNNIDTGAVGTLKVAGNAVTVPAGTSAFSGLFVTTAFADVLTGGGDGKVTIDWGPANIAPAAVHVIAFVNFNPQNTGTDARSLAIRISATVGGTGGDVAMSTQRGFSQVLTTQWGYNGHTGVVTYSVQALCAESGADFKKGGFGLLVLGLRR